MKRKLELENNSFDIIRAVCAVLIFLGHFMEHLDYQPEVLYKIAYFVRGVPVFFLLSGFLVARSLERYKTKEFLVRRFFRIYPSLWTCIIVNTVIIFSVYEVKPTIMQFLIYLVTQFTFCQFYTGSWLRGYGVGVPNGALWTICADIQFYVVAILLARWLKKRSIKVWVVLIVLCMAFSFVLKRLHVASMIPDVAYKLLYVTVLPYLFIFLIGMMAYYHREKILPFLMDKAWIITVIYCIWQFLPGSFKGHFDVVRYNAVSTVLLCMMVLGLGYRLGKHRVKTDYSYAFYLYHMIVINFVNHVIFKQITSPTVFTVTLIICFVVICLMAVTSVQLVDKRIAMPQQKKVLSRMHTAGN